MIYLKAYEIFGSGAHASFDNDLDEPFWGNLGAGVLPYSKTTKRFLINYRSKYVNEPNTWNIWGGKIDTDENIKDAVKREFWEESKYDGDIELIDALIFKNPNGQFKYYNFIGIIKNEFIPVLDWESENYKWVSYDELIKLKNKHFGLENLLNDENTIKIIQNL